MSKEQPPGHIEVAMTRRPLSERVRYFSKELIKRGNERDDMEMAGMGIALSMVADDVAREVEGRQP